MGITPPGPASYLQLLQSPLPFSTSRNWIFFHPDAEWANVTVARIRRPIGTGLDRGYAAQRERKKEVGKPSGGEEGKSGSGEDEMITLFKANKLFGKL